jgi:hypothetical protein
VCGACCAGRGKKFSEKNQRSSTERFPAPNQPLLKIAIYHAGHSSVTVYICNLLSPFASENTL